MLANTAIEKQFWAEGSGLLLVRLWFAHVREELSYKEP